MTGTYDLIVVGEGIAGLTCAAECSKAGLRVATFEAEYFGGQVVNINELADFDEAGGLSGLDHAGVLAMANKKAGVQSRPAAVTAIHPTDSGFEVQTSSGNFTSRFVVIASGAHLKKLAVPGEQDYEGRGVSHCADCDAPMFAQAQVIVVGAGDWAVQDALLLARESAAVHLVFEQTALTACDTYIECAAAQPRIHLHAGMRVLEILGDESGMTGVVVSDVRGESSLIAATGLFAMTGLSPNSQIAPAQAVRDAAGYVLVNADLETVVPGLWAIGQVRAGFEGWLKHAVADARRAAGQITARAG